MTLQTVLMNRSKLRSHSAKIMGIVHVRFLDSRMRHPDKTCATKIAPQIQVNVPTRGGQKCHFRPVRLEPFSESHFCRLVLRCWRSESATQFNDSANSQASEFTAFLPILLTKQRGHCPLAQKGQVLA